MKRVFIALIFHSLFSFLCLFIYFSFSLTLPELISGVEGKYKLFFTIQFFLRLLPAIICGSYIVAYAAEFGKDDKHIMIRYSPYIISRLKYVVIYAIIGTGLVVCAQEVCSPLVRAKIVRMEESPSLFKEYLQAAQRYDKEGNLVVAIQYATAAEGLNPQSKIASALKNDLEIKMEGRVYEDLLGKSIDGSNSPLFMVSERNITSYELLQKAKESFANKNWIDAHYYSIMARKVAEPGSANEIDAKIMAADAWNMLEEPGRFENSAVEELYRRKKEAYSMLMMGNIVEAYYSFSDLMQSYPDDEDIVRYYTAAAKEMEVQYFFLDEIPISFGMEDRRDIAFRLKHPDGSESVVFIKGLSSVGNTGGLVQYARGLSIYDFSKAGNFRKSMYVPYAKILSQSISSLDEQTREYMEMSGLNVEKGTVPVIMLESVDRILHNSFNKPVYEFAEGVTQTSLKPIISLPMPYMDFLMLKNTSQDPEEMMLFDVIQMATKAADYGYAQEVYGQDVLTRMGKPLLYIVLFITLASIGWNYRIMSGRFRFIWILTPSFVTIGIFLALEIGKYAQRLLNYGLFSFLGLAAAPVIFVIAVICIIFSVVFFLTRRSQ